MEQFLARWERSAASTIPIRYQAKGGAVHTFATYICASREVQKRYLFQLIRGQDMGAASLSDLTRIGPTGKPSPGDTTFIQKQKLDCAVQLTRSVVLDLNNVLTCILGHTSIVLAQLEPTHPVRASIAEVERAAVKAAEISHQLAAFSRQEKEAPVMAAGNLNPLVRRVVDALQPKTPSSTRWQLHFEDHLYSVKCDEAKVQQALSRIVENAVEAIDERGRITLTTRSLDISEPTQDLTAQLTPGTYVCIEVSDDGKGIAPENLPRIFEPFFTTKVSHRGLGLAWAYGVITNHRGSLAISSEPSRGTSVRVYLPASQKVVTDTVLQKCDIGPRRTILYVDDEDLLLNMAQAVLSAYGYNVLTASSGPKALELLEVNPPEIDLVVTDMVMPQMSGTEFIEQLQVRLPGVPILRTSGFVRTGGDDDIETYLQKPYNSQTLLRRIKHLLAAEAAA